MPDDNAHIVTVDNVTINHLPDEAADDYRVTITGIELNDIETIDLTDDDAHAFMETLYTAQRASSTNEWDGLPANVANLYDAVVYLSHYIRTQNGDDAFAEELDEMREGDRWQTTP